MRQKAPDNVPKLKMGGLGVPLLGGSPPKQQPNKVKFSLNVESALDAMSGRESSKRDGMMNINIGKAVAIQQE